MRIYKETCRCPCWCLCRVYGEHLLESNNQRNNSNQRRLAVLRQGIFTSGFTINPSLQKWYEVGTRLSRVQTWYWRTTFTSTFKLMATNYFGILITTLYINQRPFPILLLQPEKMCDSPLTKKKPAYSSPDIEARSLLLTNLGQDLPTTFPYSNIHFIHL